MGRTRSAKFIYEILGESLGSCPKLSHTESAPPSCASCDPFVPCPSRQTSAALKPSFIMKSNNLSIQPSINRCVVRAVVVPSLFLIALATTSSVALCGPDWDEGAHGDAGSTASTAQVITTAGTVNTVRGSLTANLLGGDYQDMYVIYVASPTSFSVSTLTADGGSATFNPMLYAFRYEGFGETAHASAMLGNNIAMAGVVGARLGPIANDNSGVRLTEAGYYAIAISGFSSRPTNAFGESLFGSNIFGAGNLVGPADGLNNLGLAGWDSDGQTGEYLLHLSGITGVPAPGAIALLGLAGLISRRRR